MIFQRTHLVLTLTALLLVASGCGSDNSKSGDVRATDIVLGVMTGEMELIVESDGIFVWGDSINKLCQQWSVARNDQSGWFYGGRYSSSSADVYVLAAPNDPLSVVAAENFDYTRDSVQASEGDTVFFRGRNGFFGAWTIFDVDGTHDAVLSGRWYFRAGGGGDFTGPIVAGGESNYDLSTDFCTEY
jgi:hypothetical protein